jgi:putative transposase
LTVRSGGCGIFADGGNPLRAIIFSTHLRPSGAHIIPEGDIGAPLPEHGLPPKKAMKFDPPTHHRHSIRLQGYDYAQTGGYYVTIVTQERICLFGEVVGGEMILNEAGKMIVEWWNELPRKFPSITADAFVVMPNHFHGIVILHDETVGADLRVCPGETEKSTHVGAGLVPAQAPAQSRATTRVAPTLGEIIGAFKSITTHAYIRGVKQIGWPPCAGKLWQRNYYEHIIRDNADWERIVSYILANPSQWAEDEEKPVRVR